MAEEKRKAGKYNTTAHTQGRIDAKHLLVLMRRLPAQGTQKRRQRPDGQSQGNGVTQPRAGRGKRRRKLRMPLADGSVQPGFAEEALEDADMMDIDDAKVGASPCRTCACMYLACGCVRLTDKAS